jgi:hypothetical protein
MVAYSYAAQYPGEVEKLALLEAPIPVVGDIWEKVYTTPSLWHFHFVNSPVALELVKGREHIFLEHFWQTLSLHPEDLLKPTVRFTPKRTRGRGQRTICRHKITPAGFDALEIQAKIVANNVTSVILKDTGLVRFFDIRCGVSPEERHHGHALLYVGVHEYSFRDWQRRSL